MLSEQIIFHKSYNDHNKKDYFQCFFGLMPSDKPMNSSDH